MGLVMRKADLLHMNNKGADQPLHQCILVSAFEPQHDISNNVVCATSKGSDQPAHMHSLIRSLCLSLEYSVTV